MHPRTKHLPKGREKEPLSLKYLLRGHRQGICQTSRMNSSYLGRRQLNNGTMTQIMFSPCNRELQIQASERRLQATLRRGNQKRTPRNRSKDIPGSRMLPTLTGTLLDTLIMTLGLYIYHRMHGTISLRSRHNIGRSSKSTGTL